MTAGRTWLRAALAVSLVAAAASVATTIGASDAVATVTPLAQRVRAADVLRPAVRLDPPPHRLRLVFSGDTLPHAPVVESARRWGSGAYDFRPMFERIRGIVEWADLAVCHLETPVAPDGEALSTHPRYGVPKEIAAGIAAGGYDRCSTASNHSLDRGLSGIDATLAALGRAGLSQSGMARRAQEAEPVVLDVAGVRVAHLAYSFSFNGFSLPAGESWRANAIDPVRIVTDARRARELGADVVVVSLHWGNEGDPTVTAYQRRLAADVTAAGAVDLVVGHHAHVIQPIEQVNGRWVVFGMGNALSNMPTGALPMASSQDGVLITVVVVEREDGTFAVERPVVHPTWVDRDAGHVIRPVRDDLADPATPAAVRAQLAASLERTRSVVGDFFPVE